MGTTTTYQYDGLGNRIGLTHNNVETAYLLDPSGALSQVLRESTGGAETLYLHGLDIIGQQRGSEWTTLGYDPLGSVRFVLNSSGDLTHALNYDPYGVPLQPNTADTALGFTGEQTDPNELIYLRARYYHPKLGAFTSVDPVLGAGGSTGWNGYLYANGNPANLTDPSGKCPEGYDWLSCYLYDTATGDHDGTADQLVFISLYTLGKFPDLWRDDLADSDKDRWGAYWHTLQAAGTWLQNAGYRDLMSWYPPFSVAFALQDALQSANPFDVIVALSGMTKIGSAISNTALFQKTRSLARRSVDLAESALDQPSLNSHPQTTLVDDPLIDNNILTSIALGEPDALKFAERYRGKMSIDINIAREFLDWNHDVGELAHIMNEHGIQFVDAASETFARSLLAPMGRTKLVPDVYNQWCRLRSS